MKTGILGGTFDPAHIGHIAVAGAVKDELGLAEVVFIPAGKPWFKADALVLSAEHRLNMVRLAIAGEPCFRVSAMEIERAGLTYSVDTVAELKKEMKDDDELFFIIGWENLIELPRWHQPQRLVSLCRLVAVPRVGFPVPDLASIEASIPGISKRVIILDEPQVDISSSVIRQRVRQGLSISHLVPEAVEKYIKEHGLYRG
ncbi:MAG: nicotinate-nucleotide adenylyltransferase [Chloroflexota bacterium]